MNIQRSKADHLLKRINKDFERQEPGYRHKKLSDSAKYFVNSHAWPGNIRELYNTLLQAAVMAEGDALQNEDLQAAVPESVPRAGRENELLGYNNYQTLDSQLKRLKVTWEK